MQTHELLFRTADALCVLLSDNDFLSTMCLQTDLEETDSEEVELSSKDLGDLLEKAVSRAQQRRGLFKSTVFQRINIPDAVNDPFSGMFWTE